MKAQAVEHPKMKRFAAALGITKREAVGIVEMIFAYTVQFAPQGDIGRWTDSDIALYVEWPQERATELVDALAKTGWIDAHDDADVRYVVHDWAEHAPDYVRRALRRKGLDFTPVSDSGGQLSVNGRQTSVSGQPVVDNCRTVADMTPDPCRTVADTTCDVVRLPNLTKPNLTKPNQGEPSDEPTEPPAVPVTIPADIEQAAFAVFGSVPVAQIQGWLASHPPGWIREAIAATEARGKKDPRYTTGILSRYRTQGGTDGDRGNAGDGRLSQGNGGRKGKAMPESIRAIAGLYDDIDAPNGVKVDPG